MQTFLKILRWLVGLLFIFSGLIKANDPLGLSYKMQEFFDVWGMSFFSDYTLALAYCMNLLEIVTGIALLLKFPYKQTLWLLLILILFFTFLTGYALFSGKIKTCGCFGDCLVLTPKTSFIKDIILLISITILLITHKKVKTNFSKPLGIFILLFSTLGVGYGQYYVLQNLPILDCLPYKVGNDIIEKMQIPADAIADSIVIEMDFIKNGKHYSFTPDKFPSDFDSTYIFSSRNEKLIKQGNGIKAPIADFNLNTLQGIDTTAALFATSTPYVLIFSGQIDPKINWDLLLKTIHNKHKLVYIVTADKSGALNRLAKENILIGDITMIKTAARVWPTIFVMNGSTIMQKKSFLDYTEK
jgi:uncharacterized membrane protein YphA (DoxX/SURF4 family)